MHSDIDMRCIFTKRKKRKKQKLGRGTETIPEHFLPKSLCVGHQAPEFVETNLKSKMHQH